MTEIDNKLEDIQEEPPETPKTADTPRTFETSDNSSASGDPAMDASFMSESIYQKLPSASPKPIKHKSTSKSPESLGYLAQDDLTDWNRKTLHARLT